MNLKSKSFVQFEGKNYSILKAGWVKIWPQRLGQRILNELIQTRVEIVRASKKNRPI